MRRQLLVRGTLVSLLAVVALAGAGSAAAGPVALLLPQATAFAILGHSCGGIQEQSYATGFDPVSGDPAGFVRMSTRCGGSGRGGGYHVTTYSASADVIWDFGGNVLSYSVPATGTGNSSFSLTDANGDQLYQSGSYAYLSVPAPPAPAILSASQTGASAQVAWATGLANPAVVTSATITATPLDPAGTTVTAVVSGSSSTGLVGPLQPSTTYSITVVVTDAGGSSPASAPVTIVTGASAVAPNAPTGVKARWTAPGSPGDTLVASWSAAAGGDSPVDSYQVTIVGSDGGGTFTQTVAGTTLTATFAVSDTPDWSVTVRAHDAAGWGPWSARVLLGGA